MFILPTHTIGCSALSCSITPFSIMGQLNKETHSSDHTSKSEKNKRKRVIWNYKETIASGIAPAGFFHFWYKTP